MAKAPLTNKQILHQVLKGLDPYISCGCPGPIWKLAKTLTREVYGKKGLQLLEKFNSEHDGSVDASKEITLHTVHGWDDPNTEVGPKELIEKLEAL